MIAIEEFDRIGEMSDAFTSKEMICVIRTRQVLDRWAPCVLSILAVCFSN